MDRRKDLTVALAIALLGLAIVVLGTQINMGRIRDPIGARTLPIITGALIFAGGLFLAGRRLVRWKAEATIVPAEGTRDQPEVPASTARSIVVWALCFAYVALLETVGFLILTPFLLAILLWIMGVRRPLRLGLITVGAVVVVFGVFDILLGVRLPLGPLDPYIGYLG
jgi:putative tricarboxylic transport membrane protein